MGSPVSPRGCKKRGWLYVPSYVPLLVGRVASYSMALAFGVSASIQSAAWAPGNVTDHGRALTDNGRALLQHEFQRTGSFCLGGHLAPLTFLLGCQRCGTNSLYEGDSRGALCHTLQPLSTLLPAPDIIGSVRGARSAHSLRGEPAVYSREQHFFATDTWSQGATHYLNHFPDCPGHSAGTARTNC